MRLRMDAHWRPLPAYIALGYSDCRPGKRERAPAHLTARPLSSSHAPSTGPSVGFLACISACELAARMRGCFEEGGEARSADSCANNSAELETRMLDGRKSLFPNKSKLTLCEPRLT